MAAPHALNPEQECDVYEQSLRRVPYAQLARQYHVDHQTIRRVVDRKTKELTKRRHPELEALRQVLFDELDALKASAWQDSRELPPGVARNGARTLVKDCIVEQARLMGLEKIQIDHRHELAAKVDAWLSTEVEVDWLHGKDPG